MKIKKRKIILSVLFLLLLSVLYKYQTLTEYKFGILASDYQDVIAEKPNYYPINENVNRYSWSSPILLPNSDIYIEIEHLVLSSSFDEKLNLIAKEKKTLICAISCEANRIESIDISVVLDGIPLNISGNFIYSYPEDNENEKYPLGWKVEKLDQNISNHNGEIGYITIFEIENKNICQILNIQKGMFKTAFQDITIRYHDAKGEVKTATYEFNLKWYKYMTFLEQVMIST